MKIPATVRVLSNLLLIVVTSLPGRAASFSAELVDTRAGQAHSGPFHCQDKSYRFEVVENGQTLVIMVDGPTGTMRLLNPAEKAFHEVRAGEPMSLFADPFALYAQYSRVKEVRTAGTESVGGVVCRKQVVHGGEQVFVTGWVAEGFDLPLKVLTQLDARMVELRNIKPGPQDPALFAVPAGYKLNIIEEEGEPQPEWVGQVTGAPLLTPPFEQSLPEGGIVRLRLQAGRWIEIAGTNTSQAQGSFTAVPFKGGKSLGPGEMSTVILEAGDSGAMSIGTTPVTADELIVRVGQGTMKIKTAYVAPQSTGAGPTPGATPEATAELSAPKSAAIAERLEISWQGPANRDDFISIARPDQAPGAYVERTMVREGSPLKVWTPSDPGDFEVRYVVGRGARLLAKSPLVVTSVPTQVTTAGPVNAAAWIEVKWEGPARDGDYISVAGPGQAPGASISRTPVKAGNPLKVRAASEPGDYEVRYVLSRGNRLLAKAPVTLNPVTAEVLPPATATVGVELNVPWRGPGYPEDFVSIARANQPPSAYLNFTPVRQGNPLKLRIPKEPGTYEVRYILGLGKRQLAKATVTVLAP